jgi:hypothetical protein
MTGDNGSVPYATGTCITCRRRFTFNPHLVQYIHVRGENEPVCLECVEGANRYRHAHGLPLFEIRPGAYLPELVR